MDVDDEETRFTPVGAGFGEINVSPNCRNTQTGPYYLKLGPLISKGLMIILKVAMSDGKASRCILLMEFPRWS